MQVEYIGLAKTGHMEAEAGVQLVRLAEFARHIGDCRLAIAAIYDGLTHFAYEVRLHVVTRAGELIDVGNCMHSDFIEAMRGAFDLAVNELSRWPG
ncbi:hypothetical protein [Paraburkholderia sp. BCC1885]|uniref:hypothetical protein n=1 Tax=Paraburkholderia sp. BCC1885 TaxID=2562669 RepID=UPI0021B432F2|nr:hypothetical protein [Paraburkholderia sp. BCC1885]